MNNTPDPKEEIPYFEDKKDPFREGKQLVERNVTHSIVYDRKTDKVLCLKWPEFDWQTFVIGGIEEGEDVIEAGKREIVEETGYTDVEFITHLGKTSSGFFAAHKDVNRIAHATGLLFELKSDAQNPVHPEETKNHAYSWIPKDEVSSYINIDNQNYIWDKAKKILEA